MLMKMNNAAVLMVVVLVLLSAAAAAAVAEEEGGCTEEVTSFSACLAYVSNPPNNLTESASEKCCKAFFSGVESLCLCYLIREPTMLGFPLNTTRIMSLSSLCPSQTQSPASTSLAFLCAVSPSLPPLNGAPTTNTTTDQPIGNNSSESSGRRVPIVTGNGSSSNNGGSSNNGYSSSNAQTLNTFLLFQFLSIIVTLLST